MIRTAEIVRAIDMSIATRSEAMRIESAVHPGRIAAGIAGRLLTGIGMIMILIVLTACISIAAPKIAGYDGYIVASGSMEPEIPAGSIVCATETEPMLLRMGDVIVYEDTSRGATITHRVVSNNPFTGTIIAKGDANEREDVNPVTYDRVVGKVEKYVPLLGYAGAIFSSTAGRIIAALMLIESWLLIETGIMIKGRC